MNPVGMAHDGKYIVDMCKLIKAMWEDFFWLIICCSQFKELPICRACSVKMNTHDLNYYRYAGT